MKPNATPTETTLFTEAERWDKEYMKLARAVSEESYCMHKVGAVIVSKYGNITAASNIVTGDHVCEEVGYCRSPFDSCLNSGLASRAIHAEIAVMAKALEMGIMIKGSVVYVTQKPCINCAKALLAFGVESVRWVSGNYFVKAIPAALVAEIIENMF